MRRSLLLALAAAVLLSFAGCRSGSENKTDGGNGSRKRTEEEKSLDLSFIPEDCFFAVVVHPKRIMESSLASELSEDLAEDLLRSMGGMWRGIDPRKIEEMVVLHFRRKIQETVIELDPVHGPTAKEYESPPDSAAIMRFSEPIANMELLDNFRYRNTSAI